MRKRNNFISVFTMFLAIGFAIIFSIPVKATANGVQLKANRTYTAYDVTGDGTKDKIRIRAANQTDDEAYSSLTVSVNGKTAYRLKNFTYEYVNRKFVPTSRYGSYKEIYSADGSSRYFTVNSNLPAYARLGATAVNTTLKTGSLTKIIKCALIN